MKVFSKFIVMTSMLVIPALTFADGTYAVFGLGGTARVNDKTVIDNKTGKSSTDSFGESVDLEISSPITKKVNLVWGGGIGMEHKIFKDSDTKTQAQFSGIVGVTYNVADNLAAGVGYRVSTTVGENSDAKFNAISGIVRYKIRSNNYDYYGPVLSAEIEKNVDNKGFGVKVGASYGFTQSSNF